MESPVVQDHADEAQGPGRKLRPLGGTQFDHGGVIERPVLVLDRLEALAAGNGDKALRRADAQLPSGKLSRFQRLQIRQQDDFRLAVRRRVCRGRGLCERGIGRGLRAVSLLIAAVLGDKDLQDLLRGLLCRLLFGFRLCRLLFGFRFRRFLLGFRFRRFRLGGFRLGGLRFGGLLRCGLRVRLRLRPRRLSARCGLLRLLCGGSIRGVSRLLRQRRHRQRQHQDQGKQQRQAALPNMSHKTFPPEGAHVFCF